MVLQIISNGTTYFKLHDIEKLLDFKSTRYVFSRCDEPPVKMKESPDGKECFFASENACRRLHDYLKSHHYDDKAALLRDLLGDKEAEAVIVHEEQQQEPEKLPELSPLTNLFRTFLYGEAPVRIIMRDNEPWFVAADVCRALDLSNTTVTLGRLDDDEKALISIEGITNGNNKTNIVNEPGLYGMVLSSRKPEAKEFKRWITHDVIPSIRNTGGYVSDSDRMLNHYFGHLDESRKAIIREAFDTIESVQRENDKLKTVNQALLRDTGTWDNRAVLVALLRKFTTTRYGAHFSLGWNRFYKELKYKKGICLSQRGDNTVPLIDKVHDDEWPHLIEVAAALCEEVGIDVAQVINEVNAERIGR